MANTPIEIELADAFATLPEVPSLPVLCLLSESTADLSSNIPIWEKGKALQRMHGFEMIPPRSELESAAGLWFFIRQSILDAKSSYGLKKQGANTDEKEL